MNEYDELFRSGNVSDVFRNFVDSFLSVYETTYTEANPDGYAAMKEDGDLVARSVIDAWKNTTTIKIDKDMMRYLYSSLERNDWQMSTDFDRWFNNLSEAYPEVIETISEDIETTSEEFDVDSLLNDIMGGEEFSIKTSDDLLDAMNRLETMPEGEEKDRLREEIEQAKRRLGWR